MWFHSEMNIAFRDPAKINDWVAQLWSEHLQIPVDDAKELIKKPDEALKFFKDQAADNAVALNQQGRPKGRVYDWKSTEFPARDLAGINLAEVHIGGGSSQR